LIQRLLADFAWAKSTDANVIVERLKKRLLLGRQISYDPIPKLQGFMIPSWPAVVPDDVDALYSSLMKRAVNRAAFMAAQT
jgi:hypothetical protein